MYKFWSLVAKTSCSLKLVVKKNIVKMRLDLTYKNLLPILFVIVLMWNCKESVNEPTIDLRPDLIDIEIISPSDSSFIFEPISITVEVESVNPLLQVEFFIDNVKLGVVKESPFTINPDLSGQLIQNFK